MTSFVTVKVLSHEGEWIPQMIDSQSRPNYSPWPQQILKETKNAKSLEQWAYSNMIPFDSSNCLGLHLDSEIKCTKIGLGGNTI